MPGKMGLAVQGVLAKINFAIEDEAGMHEVDARELRAVMIDRLFNATEPELRGMLHAEADRQSANV